MGIGDAGKAAPFVETAVDADGGDDDCAAGLDLRVADEHRRRTPDPADITDHAP